MSGVPENNEAICSGKNGKSYHGIEGSIVGSNDGNSIPSDPDTEENDEGSKNDMEEALGELAMFMCCVGLVPFKVVEDMFFLNLGYKLVEYDEQKTLRALADFVCSVDFPPQLLNHITFRKLANRLNPLFNLTYGMVRSECIKVYEERKWSIKEYLGNLDGQISLSVDVLGYENVCNFCCYDYVCLSAHFIDENWKLRKWVLYFHCLWDPSVNCSEDCGIFKSLEDLEIADKISTLATSNDHRYAKMFEYVKTHVQEKKELQLSGQLFNVYCFGEIISQMVVDAFHKIRDLIDRVGELYSSKSLPLSYLTSSNLKQALELWSMGEFSSKDVTDSYDVPSPEEWKIVEGVCKIVDSIYEVSNALFQTKHLTANVYLYHLHELREILSQMSSESEGFIATVVQDMMKKYDKYWDDMFLLLAICAVLDPRFKMKYVEFICSKVKGGDGSSQVAAVLGAFNKLFDDYVIRFPEKENLISESSSSDSDSEEESPPRQENHTFGVLQAYQQFIQLDNQPTKKSDLEYYLEEPVLPWSQDLNALTWWRTAGAKYPVLSRMARDLLAIPVSLATSFDAFYTKPRPIDERLVCLKPDLMNALICTRSWYGRFF